MSRPPYLLLYFFLQSAHLYYPNQTFILFELVKASDGLFSEWIKPSFSISFDKYAFWTTVGSIISLFSVVVIDLLSKSNFETLPVNMTIGTR